MVSVGTARVRVVEPQLMDAGRARCAGRTSVDAQQEQSRVEAEPRSARSEQVEGSPRDEAFNYRKTSDRADPGDAHMPWLRRRAGRDGRKHLTQACRGERREPQARSDPVQKSVSLWP